MRVRIGLLFSRTGTYRLIAEACRRGALRGVAEANADAALGLMLEVVERDPGGEADAYAPLCAELLGEGARHVVGCVTSWSRKEVIPTLERLGGVLWYPCPYEGFEASGQVVYAHACPNQHLLPLLAWALPRLGRRSFLTGSNYIWGWEMNRVAREVVGEAGGEVGAERYLPLGDTGVGRLVEEVRATRPAFVLNNLVGQSSYAFLAAMAGQGVPVLSCNLSECELPVLGEAAEGLVSVGPHFGATSSFEEAARAAVLTLAARVSNGGDAALPELLARQGGPLDIDPATHHATLPVVLARVEGGVFAPFERQGAVAPDPYLARRAPAVVPRLRAVVS